MFVISLSIDGATGANNNDACLNSVGQEFGNFAVITKNGVPLTPPNPLGLNFGQNNPDLNNVLPMAPGEPRQREFAFRAGVNIVMYTLTGNYKADQVHVPALLERLGQ